jgi:hypothetical protein
MKYMPMHVHEKEYQYEEEAEQEPNHGLVVLRHRLHKSFRSTWHQHHRCRRQ